MPIKRASLAELMGPQAAGGGMKLSNLHEILGESMPELPRNPVGRHRLVRSLQQRFGPNFRSLPGVANLMKEFDDEMKFEVKLARMRAIKHKPKEK